MNSADEVLIGGDEDGSAKLDGVEGGVVEGIDDGAATADVRRLFEDVDSELYARAGGGVVEEKGGRGSSGTCTNDGNLVGKDVSGDSDGCAWIEPIQNVQCG